jgi:hypothetical protein
VLSTPAVDPTPDPPAPPHLLRPSSASPASRKVVFELDEDPTPPPVQRIRHEPEQQAPKPNQFLSLLRHTHSTARHRGLCSAPLLSSPRLRLLDWTLHRRPGRRRHRQVPNCPHRSPLYKYGAAGFRHKILPQPPKRSPRNPPPAHSAVAIGLSPSVSLSLSLSRRRRRILRP